MTKIQTVISASLVPVLACFLVACGKGAEKGPSQRKAKDDGSAASGSPSAESSSSSRASGSGRYRKISMADPGALSVVAKFTGAEAPAQPEINVNINPEYCGGKVVNEGMIFDAASRGLKNVVVRLEGIHRGGKAPPKDITITNRNCMFEPHVSATMVGAKLKVANADPILHTTHPYYEGGLHFFNVPLNDQSAKYPGKEIQKLGVMEVKCDVHKWMNAYIVVHDNPYVGVSDAAGRLTIDEVPPGTYSYAAWHEMLGQKKGNVTIEKGKTAELELEFAGK